MRETEKNLLKFLTAAPPQWLLTLQVAWLTCQERYMPTGIYYLVSSDRNEKLAYLGMTCPMS